MTWIASNVVSFCWLKISSGVVLSFVCWRFMDLYIGRTIMFDEVGMPMEINHYLGEFPIGSTDTAHATSPYGIVG